MRFVAIAALLLVACAPERCELVSGVYVARFAEVSGTCGALPNDEDVLSANLGPPFSGTSDDVCFGPIAFTDDMCSVDYDRDCDVYADDGARRGSVRFVGTNTIVASTRVEGFMEITANIDGDACSSVCEIAWTMR